MDGVNIEHSDWLWFVDTKVKVKMLKCVYIACNAYILEDVSGLYLGHCLSMVCRWQERIAGMTLELRPGPIVILCGI